MQQPVMCFFSPYKANKATGGVSTSCKANARQNAAVSRARLKAFTPKKMGRITSIHDAEPPNFAQPPTSRVI